MKDFDRNSIGKSSRRPSGRRSSGRSNRSSFSGSGFRKQEMHKVICDKCGQSCEVPFKPTKSKPVYCSDCFEKEDSPRQESGYGRSRGEFSSRRESRPESDSELKQINAKLDKILELLNED